MKCPHCAKYNLAGRGDTLGSIHYNEKSQNKKSRWDGQVLTRFTPPGECDIIFGQTSQPKEER